MSDEELYEQMIYEEQLRQDWRRQEEEHDALMYYWYLLETAVEHGLSMDIANTMSVKQLESYVAENISHTDETQDSPC